MPGIPYFPHAAPTVRSSLRAGVAKKRFSKAVEELVADKKLDYLDAMAYVVKQRGLDIRNVPKLLTPSLKEKLTAQVSKANLIRDKKTNKLPI